MIINPYYVLPPYDPNASAFINATGISGAQATSINNLVLDLKSANLWNSSNALYPFIGGTSTTHKYNLKNPLDTNAAFRLGFTGGWIHDLSGATPNGMNTIADTFLVGSTVLTGNNSHVSFYSITDSDTGGSDFGNTSNAFGSITRSGNVMYSDFLGNGSVFVASPDRITVSNTSSKAFFIFSSTASNIKVYKNENILGQKGSATSSAYPSTNILFSYGFTSGANRYSNRQLAFASIGNGFDDGQSQLYYQIVEKYQVSLNRNVNPVQSFYYNRNLNNNTNRFLFSTQITDTTIQSSLNLFEQSLRDYNIWNKMKAIYPFVGGTATTHKYNLVNPLDTNAAYRLNFVGGWTHSPTGILANGSTSYADTFLNLSTAFSLYSAHYSYYIRNNTNTGVDIGVTAGSPFTSEGWSAARAGDIAHGGFYDNDNAINSIRVSNTDSRGFYVSSIVSNASTFMTKNTTTLGNVTPSSSPANTTIYIGAAHQASTNTAILLTNHEYSFVSIGDGLTIADANNLNTAVQAFQTALGRQV